MKRILTLLTVILAVLPATGVAFVRPDSVYIQTFDAKQSENADAQGFVEAAPEQVQEPTPDQTLAGLIIGIDPGHQLHSNSEKEAVSPGSKKTKAKVSSGTAGVKTRRPEHEVNLEISLALRDALIAKGADVVMTRVTADVDISNIERAVMINEANADICLRIHCNGSTSSSANGTALYVRKTGDKAEESAEAAQIILDCMCAHTGAKNRGIVKNNDYTGLNWSTVPSILVEMGFMSNAREDELLSDPEYQKKLIDGMTEGIEKYFGRDAQE